MPVVVKFNVPATVVFAPRVKSALVVVKFALAPVLMEFKVNASVSVKLKLPAPVKFKSKELRLVAQVRVEAALRKVILALVAVKLTFASPSDKSFALMVNAAG